MAIEHISDFDYDDINFVAMMESINYSYKGKADVTLSNYDNDLAPAVKVGSVFDINGALYRVEAADETPSGYAGISNDTMFYLVFDVSALGFVYTSTAPTWDDSKQGWYNGNDRYFFSMYKDSGGTLYEKKYKLIDRNNIEFTDLIKTPIGIEVSQYIILNGTVASGLYTTLSNILRRGITILANGFITAVDPSTNNNNPVYINSIKFFSGSDRIELYGFGPSFSSGSYNGLQYGLGRLFVLTPTTSSNIWASIVF